MEQLKKYKKCNNFPGLENDNSQETISTGKYIQKCYDSKGNKTTTTTESSSEKKDRENIEVARNRLKDLTNRILKTGGKKKSRKQKKTKRINKKRRSTRRK